MLFKLYLVSTLYSYLTIGVFIGGAASRLKREGYKGIRIKKSLMENLFDWLSLVTITSLPIVNIGLCSVVFFCSEKIYNDIKDNMIREKKIEKIKEDLEEKEIIDFNNDDMNNNIKKYSDLSIDEKIKYLEQEKNELIRIKENSKKDKDISYDEGPKLRKSFKPDNL